MKPTVASICGYGISFPFFPKTGGQLETGSRFSRRRIGLGSRSPEVVGSNPTAATKTKLKGAIVLSFNFWG